MVLHRPIEGAPDLGIVLSFPVGAIALVDYRDRVMEGGKMDGTGNSK